MVTAAPTSAADKVTFEDHVRPILRQHCAGCHNQDDAASDFAVDGYDATLAGGAGGEVLSPGEADGSRLWRLVNHDEQPVMPPGGGKLPAGDLEILRAWIEGGLLQDADSEPAKRKKPAIAAVDPSRLGKPTGEPAMPSGVFRQPVLTSSAVGPIDSLAASPWAPLVAVPWQRQVSLYHAESHELLGVLPYLDGAPRVVRFSRDGSLLLVAGGEEAARGTAALYDVATGVRLATVGDEVDAVLAADISPDNRLVAIGGPKKKVRVYRVADSTLAYTCEKHTDWITALAFSPDGDLLVTADRVSGLRLWSAHAGHERADLRGHKQAITAVAWRRDGGLLASASEDGGVRLWNPEGKQIKSWNAHAGGVRSVAFAADGRLATAGRDRRVKLWKPDGGGLGELAKTDDAALAVVFTNDDKRVAISDWTGQVRLIDLAKKKPIAPLSPNPPTLESRLTAATVDLERRESEATESQSLAEAAAAALEAGRQLHADHDARLAESQRVAAEADAALTDAEATAAQRERAHKAVRAALEEVEQTFVAIEVELADTEPEAEGFAALQKQADSARASRDATAAAAKEAQALCEESIKALDLRRVRLEEAEALVAKIENQVAGLPDLSALESDRNEQQSAAGEAQRALSAARSSKQASEAELARYNAAAEVFSTERAAAAKRLAEAEQAAAEANARRADAESVSETAQKKLRRLQAELTTLRERLKSQRAEAGAANAAIGEVEADLRAIEADHALAEHAARVAEARVEGLEALQRFRAERAAR